MTTKVPVADEDGNYHTIEVPVIGPPIRAMVDMVVMAAYGHKSRDKTMFESSRTRPAFRAAFAAYSLKVAIDKVDDFFESWIEYRSSHGNILLIGRHIHTYTYIYVGVRIKYCNAVYDTYSDVYMQYMYV